ncbi:MAG: hypothetical protein HQM03_12145 [Magnetococcales bacterium]|nr:hypothetical protein [Magnetococcales bacterium]
MELHLKLHDDLASETAWQFARTVLALGATGCAPLFPDETDAELSTMYVVTVPASRTQALISRLAGMREVEYVEAPPKRALIHPVRR